VARIFVIWGLVVKPLSLKSIAKILGWDCHVTLYIGQAHWRCPYQAYSHRDVYQEKEQRADPESSSG
jgi:hypothetical protein